MKNTFFILEYNKSDPTLFKSVLIIDLNYLLFDFLNFFRICLNFFQIYSFIYIFIIRIIIIINISITVIKLIKFDFLLNKFFFLFS